MDKLFISFLGTLEGAKTKTKNLHWAAPKNDIHVRLDELLGIIDDYQDALAEEVMGIEDKIGPNDLVGKFESVAHADELIEALIDKTELFYNKIPADYVGVKSETESFIHNLNKYKYLFSLCK